MSVHRTSQCRALATWTKFNRTIIFITHIPHNHTHIRYLYRSLYTITSLSNENKKEIITRAVVVIFCVSFHILLALEMSRSWNYSAAHSVLQLDASARFSLSLSLLLFGSFVRLLDSILWICTVALRVCVCVDFSYLFITFCSGV